MFTPRRTYRIRIALPASLVVVADEETTTTRLDGCTLDLSQDGVGVFAPAELPVGQPVRVVVEEPGPGHRCLRRWTGSIVNVRAGDQGYRLGISFDAPDDGPALSLRVERGGGRSVLVRVDPPWGEPAQPEADRQADPAPERPAGAPRSGPDTALLRVFQATIVLGFLADQLTKAQAFAAGLAPVQHAGGVVVGLFERGLPMKNFGLLGGIATGLPLERQAMGLLGLVLTAMVGRLALEARSRWSTAAAVGWGCLFAGVFGNTADRLVLGFVRDFLRSRLCPSWCFNIADLLTLGGALLLLLATATRRAPGPVAPRRLESADLRARSVPLGP